MSGNVYSASFNGVSVSAVQDLFEILTPSDAVIELLSIEGGQEDLVAAELLQIQIRRVSGAPTSGSGGSTPTPRPTHQGGVASGVTCEANNTTQLSGGTNTVLRDIYWQVLQDFIYRPIPEERFYFSPSTRLLIELPVAPSAATNMSFTVTWRELGG